MSGTKVVYGLLQYAMASVYDLHYTEVRDSLKQLNPLVHLMTWQLDS